MKSIPVVYSFARSGGTLLNQLLGVHPECLVLSEVNPAASYKSVAEQATDWLNLVAAIDVPAFKTLPYDQQITTVYERSVVKGKTLIIRDWPTVNFLPNCAGERIKPSHELEQELYLRHGGFEPIPLVVARRGAAVYESIKRSFSHLNHLELDIFAECYVEYARAVANFPKIHLENLRADPLSVLSTVLTEFNLSQGSPLTSSHPAILEADRLLNYE
jgi:hypothetical protein